MTKTCRDCKLEKEEKEFGFLHGNKLPDCKKCRNARSYRNRKNNPERIKSDQRRGSLIRNAGIDTEVFDKIMEHQNGLCAICGLPNRFKRNFHVDHNHTNKNIRGLLCQACNSGLANFQENPYIFSRAIAHLVDDGNSIKHLVTRTIRKYSFPEDHRERN